MFELTQKRKRYDKQFKVSAAKVVLSGEMTVKDLAEELGIKDSTLRRWAAEYQEMGETALRRSTRTTRLSSSRRKSKSLSARTRY